MSEFVIRNGVLTRYAGKGGRVVIPDGVTAIAANAFRDNGRITEVVLPDSVQSIGYGAFEGCGMLASVSGAANVTEIGAQALEHTLWIAAQSPFAILNSILVRYSGKGGAVTVPDGVTTIGDGALEGCDALEDIAVSSKETFDRCWNRLSKKEKVLFLRNALLSDRTDSYLLPKVKAGKKNLVALAIEENNGEIVSRLFSLYKTIPLEELNQYLQDAAQAPAVVAILLDYKAETYSVERQEKHEAVMVEKELGFRERSVVEWKKIFTIEPCDGGVKIKAYKGDETDIVIPGKIGKDAVVAIGAEAFGSNTPRLSKTQKEQHKSITSVTIPDGVTDIEKNAFSGCTSLASVTIPDSVTQIGEEAFSWCTSLTSITIPDGVTEIQWGAFSDCISLTSIVIPDSVRKIDSFAFSDCKTFTIHGKAGSEAQTYAKKHNIPFAAE